MKNKRCATTGAMICATAALLLGLCCTTASAIKKRVGPAANVAAVADGNSEFAIALYGHLQQEPDRNLFFSPYDISSALAMAAAGAAGPTEKQMAEVLHFRLPAATLHPAMLALRQSLTAAANDLEGFDLRIANRLWGQKGLQFAPAFLRICQADYDASLGQVDFSGEPDAVRETINAWIARRTNGKIPSMIPPGMITSDTRLALTSAVYFKAQWADVFDMGATKDAPFHTSATKDVNVPLMRQSLEAKHADLGDFQLLALPYGIKSTSTMFVFLPKTVGGLAEMERQITLKNLDKWIQRLAEGLVNLELPRFKVTATVDLKEALQALGMTLAFDPEQADFSGITSDQRLCLSRALHQAFVEVNEEGTEAAASTVMMADEAKVTEEKPVDFRADRPFVFLIRDNRTQTILFMGRLVNPAL